MDSPYLFPHAPRLSLGVFVKPPVPNPSYTGFLVLTHADWLPIDSDMSLRPCFILYNGCSSSRAPFPRTSCGPSHYPAGVSLRCSILIGLPDTPSCWKLYLWRCPGVLASSLHLSCRRIIAEQGFVTFTAGNPALSARPVSWVLSEQY